MDGIPARLTPSTAIGAPAARVSVSLEIDPTQLSITAAPPDLLSQCNVEQVTGIPKRIFLEMLRAPGFPLPVVRVGKLRIVPRLGFLAHVLALTPRGAASAPANDIGSVDPVEALAAELGLERAPAPRAARKTAR